MKQCWLEGSWMDKSLQGLLMFKTPEQLSYQRLWLWLLHTWGSFSSACAQALLSCLGLQVLLSWYRGQDLCFPVLDASTHQLCLWEAERLGRRAEWPSAGNQGRML